MTDASRPRAARRKGSGTERDAPLLDEAALRALAGVGIVLARLRAGGEGSRRAGRRGGRVEFAGHRPYSAGDDVRTIDWAALARTGRLVVKEFESEEGLDVVLVLDRSASMESGGKLESALRIAYAVGWVALRGGARVRVATASDGELAVADEAAGAGGAAMLRDVLLDGRCGGATRLSASLAKLPPSARGSRLVVLASDLLGDDDGRRALAAMTERGDDVVIVHLRAAADLAGGDDDAVLEDAETGERIAAGAGAAERARRFAARNEEEWRAFSARRRLRYVPVDAAAPFDAGMVRALRAAGVLS